MHVLERQEMIKIIQYSLAIIIFLGVCSSRVLAEPIRNAHTQVELLMDENAIQPGQPFWIGLHMDMDDEWQTYWKNPGDSGLATTIQWELPEGFEADAIHWPYPMRMDYPELTSYGYEDEVILLNKITPPEDLKVGSQQTIKAHVTWLACGNICIPGKADLSLELSVQSEDPSINGSIRDLFNWVMADWPLETSEWAIGVYDEGESFRLHLIPPDGQVPALTQAVFFPERNDLIDHRAEQAFSKIKDGYQLVVPKSPIAYKNAMQFKGALVSREAWEGKRRALSVDEAIYFQEAGQ